MVKNLTFRNFFILFICIIVFQIILSFIIINFVYIKNIQKFVQPWNDSCVIDDIQAISALKRVKTEKCKQKLMEHFCLIKRDKPWPDSLQNRCVNFGN